MHTALTQAQDEDRFISAARSCLETALAHCQALATAGKLVAYDQARVEEVQSVLARRGWC